MTTAEASSPPVLVIDDHELLATTLVLALRQVGLEAFAVLATTADGILNAIEAKAPALVLLDLDLGPSLGSALPLIRPISERGCRVVMMTGATDRTGLAACLEAGAIGIIGKVSDFETLVEMVRRATAGDELMTTHQRDALLNELWEARRVDRRRLDPFAALTPKEHQTLARLMMGQAAEAIAAESVVSLATVRSQIQSVLRKLGVRSQLAAVALARNANWKGRPDLAAAAHAHEACNTRHPQARFSVR